MRGEQSSAIRIVKRQQNKFVNLDTSMDSISRSVHDISGTSPVDSVNMRS